MKARHQKEDDGKFSFLNRSIRDWSNLPVALSEKNLPATEFKYNLNEVNIFLILSNK